MTLPKKPRTLGCNKDRPVSVTTQITNIVLRIALERIRAKTRSEAAKNSVALLKKKEQHTFRIQSERNIKIQREMHLTFIDCDKAFNSRLHSYLRTLQWLERT